MTRERSAVERPRESGRYLAWLPIVAAITGAIVSGLLAAVVVIPGFHQGTDLSSARLPGRLGLAVIVLTPGVFGLVLELLTARLFVDADGIMFWRYFRRVRLRWADIRSLEVVRARSLGPWSEVLVRAKSGDVHLHGTIGTIGHASRLAKELSIDHARAGGSTPEAVDPP
jgi:Bacterial PH domain